MYHRLGHLVVGRAFTIILGWIALVLLLVSIAPDWKSVTQDGEFAFLPHNSQSRLAERLYREAFGDSASPASEGSPTRRGGLDPLYSNIVIVVRREDRPRDGLQDADYAFIQTVLMPRLKEIAATTGKGYEPLTPQEQQAARPVLPSAEQIVSAIITQPPKFRPLQEGDVVGSLMGSEDDQSTLVFMQLTTEFLDRSNTLIISEVERMLGSDEVRRAKLQTPGLALDLSGSAVVGRDVLRAEKDSASRTEHLTQGLVIVLLLIIYRAPVLAMIPLITVGLSVELTKLLLRVLAGWHVLGIFTGLEVYVTVVVYGAGVDYCLFLIARYREELDHGRSFDEALSEAVHRVGAALATSAGTSIFGIGMMVFADFGKFRQAGVAISLGLTVVLCSALTFTPAMLRLWGRWAFWPDLRHERIESASGWLPSLSFTRFIAEQRWIDRGWDWIADKLMAHPGRIFLGTVGVLMPLAVLGTLVQHHLSYGLLTDLPQQDPSVVGAKAVQKHFPAGFTGQTQILLKSDKFDLKRPSEGRRISEEIIQGLTPRMADLDIADIRSQAYPLGLTENARRVDARFNTFTLRKALTTRSQKIYASMDGPHAGQVMMLEFTSTQDPFLRDSIGNLGRIEQAVLDSLPAEYRDSVQLYSIGPTASLRDLKVVTDADRFRIDVLVVIVVYLLLVALLRRPAICTYLLITVVFSFLVTLGATYLVFWLREPGPFAGLDWKIPLFLFTILIAIGEDYNILLMARVTEEQEKHGLIRGVIVALTKTGSIISSCGVIMAGTFASLMTGSLMGMVQMGFALAFGVLLDTFVVRPILVPAYLILLYSGRFGRVGRWLGAESTVADIGHASPELPGDDAGLAAELAFPTDGGAVEGRTPGRDRTGEFVEK